VIAALGQPDKELPGPNAGETQLYYRSAQLTVDLIPHGGLLHPDGSPEVFDVDTGATENVNAFGGDYRAPIFGIHRGDSLESFTSAWGDGEESRPPDVKQFRTYKHQVKTSSGGSVVTTVYYDAARGVYAVSFARDRGSMP
jgi:hypothetical protein